MKLKIYSYKNCSTCQKALKYLQSVAPAAARNADIIDITTTAPTFDELKAMAKTYGGQVKKLFNTSGQVYRELQLGSKLPQLSEEAALKLLASNGRLGKRPFLLVDGQAKLVGFKESDWQAVL